MAMKINVAVPISGRSDRGLSAPIIKRLCENPNFEVDIWNTPDDHKGKLTNCLLYGQQYIRWNRPDLIIIVGDRIEMLGYSMAAYHSNIPIAHIYAGITGDAGTFDTINRHVITLWSSYQFCEDLIATTHVTRLKLGAGQQAKAWTVGCTHIDDIRIDETMVPFDMEYILVMYNPLTIKNAHELINDDIDEIFNHLLNGSNVKWVIWMSPNSDPNNEFVYELIIAKIAEYGPSYTFEIKYINNDLDRAKFIGLLKNCKLFIGNSSCMYYEAPYFLQQNQIIPIGIRNENRNRVTEYGASDQIVQILEKELCHNQ